MKNFWLHWNWVQPPHMYSFLELFVATLAMITGFHLYNVVRMHNVKLSIMTMKG